MGVSWAVFAVVFAIVVCAWPLTFAFDVRIGGGARAKVSFSGLLWRVRLRAVYARATVQETSVEVRVLQLLTLRKTWPAFPVAWRGLVPSRGIVPEFDAVSGKTGDGGKPDDKLVWDQMKQWAEAWKRRRPAARSFGAGLRFVGRRLAVTSLHIALRFGFGDAAVTAVACGLLWAVIGAALGRVQGALRFERPPLVRVQPLSTAGEFDLRVAGQASVRQFTAAAGLALAAAVYVGEKLSGIAARIRRSARRGTTAAIG